MGMKQPGDRCRMQWHEEGNSKHKDPRGEAVQCISKTRGGSVSKELLGYKVTEHAEDWK